jgi:hypothetical protein
MPAGMYLISMASGTAVGPATSQKFQGTMKITSQDSIDVTVTGVTTGITYVTTIDNNPKITSKPT